MDNAGWLGGWQQHRKCGRLICSADVTHVGAVIDLSDRRPIGFGDYTFCISFTIRAATNATSSALSLGSRSMNA
ncbi:MAG TPA: hypothetical protein VMV81_12385, partial [Phycisphaerae bacterium]|nr:hypothetical protein [Phycisphaerae bacterium]